MPHPSSTSTMTRTALRCAPPADGHLIAWMGPPVDFAQPRARHVRVALRRRGAGMSQPFLDGAQIGPTIQQVGGKRVPQGVRAQLPADAGGPRVGLYQHPYAL